MHLIYAYKHLTAKLSRSNRLAESIREMLALMLAPAVPASLKNIPPKYNLIIRLLSHAFYHLLESLVIGGGCWQVLAAAQDPPQFALCCTCAASCCKRSL